MSAPLRFHELIIRRMPGFPGGGLRLSSLSPGLNLVHGPNASGKTTTAVALQAALWHAAAPDGASLEARFELDGATWLVDVEGGRPRWQREGAEASAPPLPPAETRDRYFLSLHGLLAADDAALAERIRVESAGGYDIARAADELRFNGRGRPHTLVNALKGAERALAEARAAEAELRQDAEALRRLEEERGRVAAEAARAETLRRAVALVEAREALARATAVVATFPAGVARLEGGELARLQEWDEERTGQLGAVAEAGAAAAAAEAELEAVGLGEEPLGGTVVTELEEKLARLRRLDDDRARRHDAVRDARVRREGAGAQLGIDPDRAPAPDPSAADADRLERLVRETVELQRETAELDARIHQLRDDAEADAGDDPARGADPAHGADPARDAEAIRLLRRWLRAPGGDDAGRRRLATLLVAAAVALAVGGVAMVVLGGPVLKGAGAAALVVAVALVLLRPSAAVDDRPALEREVARVGRAPEAWTSEAVEALLDALERSAAEGVVAEERAREADRLERRRPELDARRAALESERDSIARAMGLDAAPGALALDVLAARLREWDAARTREREAAEALADVEREEAAVLETAAALVAPFGYAPADADGVAAALAELRDRRARQRSALDALQRAREARRTAEAKVDELEARRAALLHRLELEDRSAEEALDRLRSWTEQLAAHREAAEDAEVARRECARAEESLAERVGPDPELPELAMAPEELGAALAEAESAAARQQELGEAVAGIRARLGVAREKHDVEDALARVADARAALADQRDADLQAAVGAALADWLRTRTSDHNRPAVFYRARELFATITRGRYRLDLPDDGRDASFRAYDTTTHRGHALDELSSGTRLQLLLAVRVAFVETQEGGVALPILLDEVLANCDDDRAAAIIDAALGLARARRQLFYFTAQADELARWRLALQAQDDVDWCVRGILDGGDDPAPVLDWPDPALTPLPEPTGLSHAAYGTALGVPRFDPWAEGVGGLHLWYLVDDPEALHQILAMGIRTWGQLELFRDAVRDRVPGPIRDVWDDARRAAALCERFRVLWRHGRGRPVDRSALEDSGAVSATFMDRVADLAAALDGDAGALIAALDDGRVPRFHSAKTEELRAYLAAHGYLSDEAPYDPRSIRVRLMAEATRGAGPGEGPGDVADRVDRLLSRLTRQVA